MPARVTLVPPAEMPPVQGLTVPEEFYWILDGEAPLAGMGNPEPDTPWSRLRLLGFRYVLNLRTSSPEYDPAPLHVLEALELEDLYHSLDPADPDKERMLVRRAVESIRGHLEPDAGVIVHCMGGTGRSGTVLGCYLRSLGVPANEIIAHLDGLHKLRGRRGWPESPWQAQLVSDYPSSMTTRK